jgi:endonuclease G
VPLQISISIGAPEGVNVPTRAAKSRAARANGRAASTDLFEAIKPDPDYASRPGYDPDFLGFSVPLPELTNTTRPLAFTFREARGRQAVELKYYHYSVIMNERRKLAFVSAVNIDLGASFKHSRKNDRDKWFIDPRCEECQAGEELYAGNPLDRGHLTRRADAAWGETAEEAKLANDDTFHFTNCSPQHEVYNQPTKANQRGLLLWGNIEEHIAEQARENKQRLCVFNGPIFRSNDRKHRDVQIPKEYWKVVVFESDDREPVALAFLLSQSGLIRDLPAEEFEVGPYQPFQIKIRDLEFKTKLSYGQLREFDPLEADGSEESFELGTEVVSIESLTDIIATRARHAIADR